MTEPETKSETKLEKMEREYKEQEEKMEREYKEQEKIHKINELIEKIQMRSCGNQKGNRSNCENGMYQALYTHGADKCIIDKMKNHNMTLMMMVNQSLKYMKSA